MTPLPASPFISDSVVSLATDAAAASKRPPSGAAANPISDDYRFELDEELFMAEIEPVPLFLQWAG